MTDYEPALSPIYLVGPTASGKTTLALELAAEINAEIVSLDSMAIYKEMDIGTAKPSAAERGDVPYHLIDIVEPSEMFSIADYVAAAHLKIAEIEARGKTPLFVGGTPLYLKAMLRGLFTGPQADPQLRSELHDAAAASGNPLFLHEMLSSIDPVAAAKLHFNDERRLIRAIEVYRKTGRRISEWQLQFERVNAQEDCRVFSLDWERQQLYERIEQRVDAMIASGLIDEVAVLAKRDPPLSKTARAAVGYRELIEISDIEAAIAAIKQRTRQLAKRQLTWLRSLPECRVVPMPCSDLDLKLWM